MAKKKERVHEVVDGITERSDTKLPVGWVILALGLIAFACYYLPANMPQWGGWSAYTALEQAQQAHHQAR